MTMYMSTAFLSLSLLWNLREGRFIQNCAAKCEPIPLPQKPTLHSSDISIIVTTINTPDSFTSALRTWVAAKPKEIIIVTIQRDEARVRALLAPAPGEANDVEIIVRLAPRANKRVQMDVGIEAARGSVVAFVDDCVFWQQPAAILPSLLAPFEDYAVGGVVGRQSAHIAPERRDPSVVTAAERVSPLTGAAGASRAGRALIRTAILKDADFRWALTNDMWMGNALNTGDDSFITRWMIKRGHKMSIQDAPEAEISKVVMRDTKVYAKQTIRWQRTSLQTCTSLVLIDPGFRALWRQYPYLARKYTECSLSLPWALAHIAALIMVSRQYLWIVLAFVLYHVYGTFTDYRAFVLKYPWAVRGIWFPVLLDYFGWVVHAYCWPTLGKDEWLTRG
ncbi:Glycosyltransferase family 2 [Mycena sanguinolenta]|uniref:Glycosyltransferase family 2 n=1 Tax=Mycena sanguinolenta TaxID=230812 RepID=A0A8H7CUD5_9AGAR|nr:Glycosyltransferase family 2 [Mycena sanguinolenta]